MGLTAIVGVDNRSSLPVRLVDIENVNAPGSGVIVPPGHVQPTNMWIPWANSLSDFSQHRLELQLGGITRYWIWQANRADDDHVRFTPGSAHLGHTIRRTDGSWTGFGDVNTQIVIPGPVQSVAAASAVPGDVQYLLATADGHLWHTIRHANGIWDSLGNVAGQIAIPGPVQSIAAASATPGDVQYLFTTADGHLWHTIRHANGTWDSPGNVAGQIQIPGPVRAVAAASATPGDVQYLFATADGHLWHTIRHANGTWDSLGNVAGQIAIPGPVQSIAAASATPGDVQYLITTADGHLWHTIRHANGTWDSPGDVAGQISIPRPVRAIAATSAVPGQAQFIIATDDGHLWHTIRQANGAWDSLGDVGGQFPIPGAVRAVAAAATQSQAQFAFTAQVGTWQDPGIRAYGISAPGVNPTAVDQGNRTIVVRDGGFELVDLPTGLLTILHELLGSGGFRRVSDAGVRTAIASKPKYSASAFSMAGPPSDALAAQTPGARFQYRDEGKRYEFAISHGAVVATGPDGVAIPLNTAVSFNALRSGQSIPAPTFDLIAANGGRVFAKEAGTDRFFFASMDEMFVHVDEFGREFAIPSSYFKVDPQFNQPGAQVHDIVAPFEGSFAGHPAAERFPVFQLALQQNLMDMMVVAVRPRVWYLIDVRPSIGNVNLEALAVRDIRTVQALTSALDQFALAADLMAPTVLASTADLALPGNVPGYPHVSYAMGNTTVQAQSIDFRKVLDVGVGHVHWYEQYESVTGGEIQPMKTLPIIVANPPVGLADLYRFMNGPIRDGDGFIDGTCNFYILVQLSDGRYALLYIDEQSYFTQRWRMVDPSDFRGMSTALVKGLNDNAGFYGWNKNQFWAPFADGLIADNSRMAVSRQVILVTGPDPQTAGTPKPLATIYSLNFSFSTIDHTWRWRTLPMAAAYFPDDASAATETIGTPSGDCVYPQTIRLREDMTINLKGAHRGPAGTVDVGRWYQRYLPANNQPVPAANALTSGRPAHGYTHPWKFAPEAVYRAADRFSHLGVYDQVDARTQWYAVTPVSPQDESALANAPAGDPWIDANYALCTRLLRFWWAAPVRAIDVDLSLNLSGLHIVGNRKAPPSLVNAQTRLRLVRRGSAWIAMHWDKRDDDLIQFDGLPVTVRLTNGSSVANVRLTTYNWVEQPPAVAAASLMVPAAPQPAWLDLTAPANVFRVRMAALDPVPDPAVPAPSVPVVSLLDVEFTQFATTSIGARYQWTPSTAQRAQLARYCTSLGAYTHGTSVWFEDIVGHVSVPEMLVFNS